MKEKEQKKSTCEKGVALDDSGLDKVAGGDLGIELSSARDMIRSGDSYREFEALLIKYDAGKKEKQNVKKTESPESIKVYSPQEDIDEDKKISAFFDYSSYK